VGLLSISTRCPANPAEELKVHTSPCHCGDDAQRHYALIARDLMEQGRADEITDDLMDAFEAEFLTAPAPEPDPF
jgi:hypothetical protein